MRVAVFLLALASVAEAQTVTGARFQLTTGPCTVHSGSGAPSSGLGAVCDVYLRTDTPYGTYRKTGASTWTLLVPEPGTTGITTVGTLSTGAISSGFGAIDIGSDGLITGTHTPASGYAYDLGALTNKFRTLHAGELWVNTLVAQNTMATIGGRVLVGPTTELTADVSTGATSIEVKHNQMVSGDRLLLESNGKLEWMATTSGPSGSGPYTYNVTRNLDGTGANAWTAGDAVFNTGQTGSGYIDLFSLGSSAFVGFSGIFNYDAAGGGTYSQNYYETDVWQPFGDSAGNTVNDAIYVGSPAVYATISMHVITPITGSSTAVWEYWNGSAWTSFTPTGSASSVGPGALSLGTLSGWATTTVNGVNAYWWRLRITSVGGGTTPGTWRLTKRGPQQWGPTIIGNVRASSTYNDVYPRWAIGNLHGTYGYSTTVYGAGFGDESAANLTIDATNGIRFRNASTTTLSITGSTIDLTNTGVLKSGSASALSTGTGIWMAAGSGTPVFRIGNPSSDYLRWDGSNLTLVSANLTINSGGITLAPNTAGGAYDDATAFKFTLPSGHMGLGGYDFGGTKAMLLELARSGGGVVQMEAQDTSTGTLARVALGGSGGSITILTNNGALYGGDIDLGGVPDFLGATSGSAGSLAGYVNVKVGGTNYRLPIYNP